MFKKSIQSKSCQVSVPVLSKEVGSKSTSKKTELLSKKIMLTLVAGACFFAVQNPVMAAEITVGDSTVLPAVGTSSGGLTCSAVNSYTEIIYPTATGDSLVINAPTADYSSFNFVGKYLVSGDVTDGSITVKDGKVGYISGGESWSDATAKNNSVIIKGGTINDAVNGGYSKYGEASGNKVTISGGTIKGMINGGWADGDKAASNNSVIIKGGTINADVWGGYSEDGEASGNTVEISGDATIIYGDVYAGESWTGNAINNTVNLGGGEIKGYVYGGHSEDAAKDFTTGNTLKVSGLNIKALNIKNFEKLYFYIPSSATDGSTMLNLTATEDTDISATTRMAGVVAIEGDSKLKTGYTVNLIKKDAGTFITTKADGTEMSYGKLTATEGVSVDYEFDILKQDDKTLVATINAVPEEGLKAQTKSLVETQAAGMAMLNGGMDMLAGEGIANAIAAAADVSGAAAAAGDGDGAGSDGVSGKGAVGAGEGRELAMFGMLGASNMKYKTGSHVDLDGWNIGLGFAKTVENNSGKLTFGPVISYGKGSYDSYLDDGIHGEGDSDYLGISLFAHQANKDGLYYEGSIGAGRVSNDYSSNDLVGADGAKVHEKYDTDSTFVAAHLGLGKKIEVSDKAKLDVYGKYFYAHQGGDDAKLATGETYHFDAVDSNRIRLGARYEIENGKAADSGKASNTLYVGTAYEYEFSGDAKATYKGMETASPSLKGSSGMLELGWKVKPNAASPLTIDLSANGWCGQKEGYGVKANFLWNF